MPSEKEKNDYVNKIKTARTMYIQPSEKNKATKRRLGIIDEDLKDLTRSIEAQNYMQGPMADKDSSRGGFLWVFKKQAYGENFYIKTKLVETENLVKVLGCHIDNIEC